MDLNFNIIYLTATILVIIAYIIFIWTHKTTEEERKRIRKRYEPKVSLKVEEKKGNNLNDEGYEIIGSIIFLILFFIYFYKVWTDPKFTLGIVGYLLIIIIIIGCFVLISKFFDSEKRYQEDLKELHTSKNTNLEYPATSFDNFIAGRMSLAKCFWFYFMFIGIIVSVIGGYVFELGHPIIIIIPVAYYVLISISLWNCATLYTKHKLENKQTYGWAITVKILIFINAFVLVGQLMLMLNIK
jgi:hypothetical protein